MDRRAARSVAGLALALVGLGLAPRVRAQPAVRAGAPAAPQAPAPASGNPPAAPATDNPPAAPASPETPPGPEVVVPPPAGMPAPPEAPPEAIPAPPTPVPAPPPPPPSPPAAAPSPPTETLESEAPVGERPPRPRLSLAVGMGGTFDSSGFTDGTHLIPSFFAEGGFGDGLLSFDLGVFSSTASGRFPTTQAPVDRLALDAYGVLRPVARLHAVEPDYGWRVLHTIGLELGLGYERDSRVMTAGSRWVLHTGARIEFPLFPGTASDLRVRLGFRRAFGLYTPELTGGGASTAVTSVGDSAEVYAGLVVVF